MKTFQDYLEEKCWAGYKQVGMKKKGNIISYKTERGKLVAGDECDCFGNELTEAEYQGKKVELTIQLVQVMERRNSMYMSRTKKEM